ncbi:hydroxycinnamoyl-CoA:piscidic acid hydroxycinnamoyltransferase-like [Alnus glutinosa]|uniref:hydroxycinnamoyl-CoA:piscidic acid hydroxycinnamoyltransferase-like n=1 Tax=Alnus glutinosa TaxID=3517 RepID=UPI002D778970|nr:hydroxycinnamoyl-CoA:piscidic acid hydroxycinnamoyltransferase-like [Alnus glutinosa]
MIIINSTSTIFPSELTPTAILPLSETESDQMMQRSHEPVVFIYKPTNDNNTNTKTFSFETMKNSLSCALVHYYPVAGRLRCVEGDRLEVHCNAMGALLLEAYCEEKLDELGDFDPNGILQDLVPKFDYSTVPIEEWPLLMVQLTGFHCGGFCVGVSLSHSVADGQSLASFMSSWAKLARGDDLWQHEMPLHDRTTMSRSREPLDPPRVDQAEFTKPPFLVCRYIKTEQNRDSSAILLKVTGEQVEGLRKDANEMFQYRNTVARRPYTRYEAVAGHMWRSVCKARAGNILQPTKVRFKSSFTKRLKPALPERYNGNAIFRTVTQTCLYGDLFSMPLSYAAGKLREATHEKMTDEYIRSALDFIGTQKHWDSLRNNHHIPGRPHLSGNIPNLSIGCWIGVPFYAIDFGWGKPVYVGPVVLNTDGKSFIIPSPADDGSLITILVCFQTQYLDSFKRFFYEDLTKKPLICYTEEAFSDTWLGVLVDQIAALVVANGCHPQSNQCFEEKDDKDSFDDEFLNEIKFEDPFQSSVDWNSPTIYDVDINDEDLVEATLYRIGCSQASVAYSCSALICLSWICHSDWQEQIADAVESNTREPDGVEPDVGPEV